MSAGRLNRKAFYSGLTRRLGIDITNRLCWRLLNGSYSRCRFIPREKRVEIGLTYIYGIGLATSKKLLAETGIDPDTRVKDLTEEQIVKIRDYIENNLHVEGDLRRDVMLDIKRLMEIGCYRGVRHRKGLPVRGQSTKQNARTRKGKKRTVGRSKK